MAVIADKCPNVKVTVVDLNKERIASWNSSDLSKLPIYEPGLDEVVKRTRNKNLYFSTQVEKAISNADMVFISVNTPTKSKGLGAGQASDLKWVEASARQVAKHAKGHTIVVEKSTLPVRTAEVIQSILEAAEQPNSEFQKNSFVVLSNPEFLSEGSAIRDLEYPDRVLIGGEDQSAIEALTEIYKNWVPRHKILCTNIWSSELSKLTANAFLAQRISSINSVSALCEVTGANVNEVAKAIGSDSRIGEKFLNSGPGFGGSCFKKDILNLVYLCKYFGIPEVAEYWQNVVRLNDWQQQRIAQIVIRKLFGTVNGKRISILGFSFKANTNDTRESPAINIAKSLLEEGANLSIYDPKVTADQIELALQSTRKDSSKKSNDVNEGFWEFSKNISESFQGTDAAIILTEWDEFRSLNWQHLSISMRKPAWIFDTRSVVDPVEIKSTGLKLWRIGDGSI